MAHGITTAFWGVTINNYDERDLVIMQNGYPDYCREIVHTLEEGKEGTPHIQAWVKLQRQQRMSFVQKLFPGGHFKPLTSDEYVYHTKRYAQKKDGTTRSASVHTFNDPIHTLESVVKKIGEKMHGHYDRASSVGCDLNLMSLRRDVEKDMVATDFRYAKVLVSATYKSMWKEFGAEILMNLAYTHTHTHTDEILSHGDSITEDAGEDSEESSIDQDGEDNDYLEESESSSDAGLSESADSCSSEEVAE